MTVSSVDSNDPLNALVLIHSLALSSNFFFKHNMAIFWFQKFIHISEVLYEKWKQIAEFRKKQWKPLLEIKKKITT